MTKLWKAAVCIELLAIGHSVAALYVRAGINRQDTCLIALGIVAMVSSIFAAVIVIKRKGARQ